MLLTANFTSSVQSSKFVLTMPEARHKSHVRSAVIAHIANSWDSNQYININGVSMIHNRLWTSYHLCNNGVNSHFM